MCTLERDFRRAVKSSAAVPSMVASLRGKHIANTASTNCCLVSAQPSGHLVSTLISRNRITSARSSSSAIAAADLHRYVDDKVADVSAATVDVGPPTFTPALCTQGVSFGFFGWSHKRT